MNAVAGKLKTNFYVPLRKEERGLGPKQSRPFSGQS